MERAGGSGQALIYVDAVSGTYLLSTCLRRPRARVELGHGSQLLCTSDACVQYTSHTVFAAQMKNALKVTEE